MQGEHFYHPGRGLRAVAAPQGEPYVRHCTDKSVPSFIQHTYALVSDEANKHIISWSADGYSFVVHDLKLLAPLLGKLFSHNNPQSWIRQANMYGFVKLGPPKHWEFQHPLFVRGGAEHLKGIERRKTPNRPTVQAAKDLKGQVSTLRDGNANLESEIDALRTSQSLQLAAVDRITEENKKMRDQLLALQAKQERTDKLVESICARMAATPRASKRTRDDDYAVEPLDLSVFLDSQPPTKRQRTIPDPLQDPEIATLAALLVEAAVPATAVTPSKSARSDLCVELPAERVMDDVLTPSLAPFFVDSKFGDATKTVDSVLTPMAFESSLDAGFLSSLFPGQF